VLPVSIAATIPLLTRGNVAHGMRAVRPIGRGADVMSKAARPKGAAPVSLAGFQPPAAGLTPARL
jgi:hypothetical protein